MTAPTLDIQLLADPAVRADPYPLLRRLREASPQVGKDGMLVVTGRHSDIAAVLRHPNASSQRQLSPLMPPNSVASGLSFLSLDPPDHTRLRRLVSAAFTPRVVAALRPRIAALVDELLDRVGADGRFDVVADLAYPLPVQIISELLGVPPADHTQFRAWSDVIARALDPQLVNPDPTLLDAAGAAREEFDGYLTTLIEARRAHPRDDLLSLLINAESAGDKLTVDELLDTCVLLIVAGHETTTNLIGNAIIALLRHPDQLDALRARPDLVDGCVEETLRYDTPVQLTTRMAAGPLPVGDAVVSPGGLAMLLIAAANRDPEVFDRPDRFDITRPPGGHLAFAAGIHFCLGAGLARLEAAVAVDALVRRAVRPRLAGPTVEYKANITLRGAARLDVLFDGMAPAR